jgi:hypothetical protein
MKEKYILHRSLPPFVGLLAMLVLGVPPSQARILPAQAHPRGTSIDGITYALAKFQDTGNNPIYYPDTRFQILFVQDFNTGTGTFTVRPGTFFFVPCFSLNDSPPILGNFPTDSSQVRDYIFSPTQLGVHDVTIEVDGKVTILDPSYLSNLIETPGLPNGGSHTILMGGFLTPLPKGTHTVTIRVSVDGALLGSFSFEDTYTVTVQ